MLKGVIVDNDENISALRRLLSVQCPALSVVAEANSANKAAELIEKHRPDVVFLHTELPGTSAFRLLDQLKHLSFYVIFTAPHCGHILKAFKYNAIDYLVKPFTPDALADAVKKLEASIHAKNYALTRLFKTMHTTQLPRRLVIPNSKEILYVNREKILRLESDHNYTNVFLTGGKRIATSKTIKAYEDQLNPSTFVRVHKAHIINLDHVKKYVKACGGYIVMADDTQIPVSRGKRSEIMHTLSAR